MYPEDLARLEYALKEAANWRCRRCGHVHDPEAGYTLIVYHLDRVKGNNSPENLAVLCQRCHLRFESVAMRVLPGQMKLF